MQNVYSILYQSLLFASGITFFISLMSIGNGKVFLGASVAGYVTCILAVMMVLLITYNGLLPNMVGLSPLRQLFTIFQMSGPFLLMLGGLSMMLYLTLKNKGTIRSNRVDPSYYTYNTITLLLLILQTYIVYQNVFSDAFEATGRFSTLTVSILYLTSILTLMAGSIVYITLQLYQTDGFCGACMLPLAVL